MKFTVCLIGWALIPVAIITVAYEVAKCWVESKIDGKAQEK
jgi:hypothetical protein